MIASWLVLSSPVRALGLASRRSCKVFAPGKPWHYLNLNTSTISITRSSFHTTFFRRIHRSVFRYRFTKNGFTGPKSLRGFRETCPWSVTCDHTLPPLYSDAVKEGMIHLLVGSYVKKPADSGFFSDLSRDNAYETLHSYWLSYFNLISGQKVGLARRKQNGGDRARF